MNNKDLIIKVVFSVVSLAIVGAICWLYDGRFAFYILVAMGSVGIRNYIGKTLDIDSKSLYVKFMYDWGVFFILQCIAIGGVEILVNVFTETANCEGDSDDEDSGKSKKNTGD